MYVNIIDCMVVFIVYSCLSFSSLFAFDSHEQVVVLGSGPAGLTAAMYTSRAGLSTLVIEGQDPGGQISFSNRVDNFPGFPEGINGFDLGEKMQEQAISFGARIHGGTIVQVDLSQRPFKLRTAEGPSILADALIIASGASAKWLGLESEKEFIGNGVHTCAICDGIAYQNQEVVVVGGGDTALEDALCLANYGSKVTVVHRRKQLRASKFLQDKAFANKKIQFIWNHVVEEIVGSKEGEISFVSLRNVETGALQKVFCSGVFVAIGHAPNTELFKGQLKLNPSGYILTKLGTTKTSVPGVFAAGGVADSTYCQAATAVGTGCMAGIDAHQFIQAIQEAE